MAAQASRQRMVVCAIVVAAFAVAVDLAVQKRGLPPLPPENGKVILQNIVSGTDAGDEDVKQLSRENTKL